MPSISSNQPKLERFLIIFHGLLCSVTKLYGRDLKTDMIPDQTNSRKIISGNFCVTENFSVYCIYKEKYLDEDFVAELMLRNMWQNQQRDNGLDHGLGGRDDDGFRGLDSEDCFRTCGNHDLILTSLILILTRTSCWIETLT